MTAEEYLKENCCNIMDEITGEFIMDTYEVTAKQMTDYLNSQRETIFKEELEKRLPSEEDIKDYVKKNGAKEKTEISLFIEIGFKEGAKWLIQYLKK